MTVVIDLDGVIWLGDEPVPGGAAAVTNLRQAGERVVFLTNNSFSTVAEHLAKLGRMGIECDSSDLVTSSQAAASLLERGERALVIGGAGIAEALAEAGVEPVEAGAGLVPAAAVRGMPAAVDAVVVGLDRRLDFDRLSEAVAAVLSGARLIATNEDATYPTHAGLIPGAGAMVAAISTSAGVEPLVAGKPHEPVARLLKSRVGELHTVVGDRPSADGGLARRLGARFALVLSGVTPAGHGPLDPEPDLEGDDLDSIWEQLLVAPADRTR